MCLSTELGACNPSPANLIGKRSQPAMLCYLSCPTVIPSANLQRSSWLNDGDLICECSSCRNLTTSIPLRMQVGTSCSGVVCCRFFLRLAIVSAWLLNWRSQERSAFLWLLRSCYLSFKIWSHNSQCCSKVSEGDLILSDSISLLLIAQSVL